MATEIPSMLIIDRFEGLVSAMDPDDLSPSNASMQINCHARRFGELTQRRGLREITYDSEA